MDDAGSTPPEGLVGRVISEKLRLIEHIGTGAMGWVFRAEHLTLDKIVAVKILKPSSGLELVSTRRFQREARTASRLDHPNIVSVFDFGEAPEDGLLFIVMEYLEGSDLERLLAEEGPMSSERLCHIMLQVLGALATAHDGGIVHRDVKPSNVFLLKRKNDDGEVVDFVKVCDFGVAKFLTHAAHPTDGTLTGMVTGTPLYMAPEQAVGDTLDPRADVYACGAMMYEMVTGRPPFDGPSVMSIILKHLREEPVRPSRIAGDIDAKLEQLILWALRKNREERCPSARVLRTALKEYADWRAKERHAAPNVDRAPRGSREPAVHGNGASGASRPRSEIEVTPTDDMPQVEEYPRARDGEVDAVDLLPSGTRSALFGGDVPTLPVDAAFPPDEEGEAGEAVSVGDEGESPTFDEETHSDVLFDEDATELEPIQLAGGLDNAATVWAPPSPAQDVQVAPEPFRWEGEEGSSPFPWTHRQVELLKELNLDEAESQRAMYMWTQYGIAYEPYRGSHPFWVRDHRGQIIGPCAYSNALRIVRQVGEQGMGCALAISGDERQWMHAIEFVRLTGQDGFFERELRAMRKEPAASSLSGALETTPLIAVLGEIARERPTGRLLLTKADASAPERVEVHVVNGKPTFVYSSELSMQAPILWVERQLIKQDDLPRLVHRVVTEEVPLEQIAAQEKKLDPTQSREILMRERLLRPFAWKGGEFAFDGDALPSSTVSFASSLLFLLPELVHRSMSDDQIREAVAGYREAHFEDGQDLGPWVSEMRLRSGEAAAALALAQGGFPRERIASSAPDDRIWKIIAYVLVGGGFLKRV